MNKDIIAQEINAEYLKGYIYNIRGVRVMLDMDLAQIYGYSTKDFNRQVKNNIEKFEQDFMFQLSDEECEILRCKNSTSSWGGRRYNPYAFTEQGIYMLMTVLKGDLAYQQIYATAKKTIFVVDNYIGLKTLVLLKDVPTNVNVVVFSDNIGNRLHQAEFNDFCREYPNVTISLQTSGGIFHDRYIVIDYQTADEQIYHCGASSKDGGNKVTTITAVTDGAIYHPVIDQLVQNPVLTLR